MCGMCARGVYGWAGGLGNLRLLKREWWPKVVTATHAFEHAAPLLPPRASAHVG